MIKKAILLLQLIVGWVLVVPLSFLVPKQRNLLLFIGAGKGQFRDNVKYLFLYFHKSKPEELEFYFLTENNQTRDELNEEGLPVILYPRLTSIFKMLRASFVIVDNLTWIGNLKYHLLFRCCKVQLWHGCSIKSLELDNAGELEKLNTWWKKIVVGAYGRFPKYDFLLSTSSLNTEKIFIPAFRSDKIIEYGYPRNDVFFRQRDALDLIGADRICIETVRKYSGKSHRTVLYAPTFRDTGSGNDFIDKEALDIDRLNRFGQSNMILFVLKIHPFRKLEYDFSKSDNVIRYADAGDVYPLLPSIHLLITDYSSIFFDFLFTDRPIVFFPYDYEKYTSKDRNLKYDYFWITPGPKCYTQDQLEETVGRILFQGEDHFMQKRKEIMELSFKERHGNFSGQIFDFLKDCVLNN
jgi:CDP-glycerol glycerophosphotransferase (TagB/SpsB family)